MKTKFKLLNRILSLLLALVLVVCVMPNLALVAHAATFNPNAYTITANNARSAYVKSLEAYGDGQVKLHVIIQPYSGTNYWVEGTIRDTDCTKEVNTSVTARSNANSIVIYVKRAATTHTGGGATCTQEGTCTRCSNTYKLNHAYILWTTDTENKSHYKACIYQCGTKSGEGSCTVNDATCLAASACSTCGYIYEEKKSHKYTYAAGGDTTITETCLNGCGHSETAKLEYATGKGTYTYTGSEIKPLKVTTSSGWQGGTLDITYSANNINVGTAKGVITKAGATVEKTFTIKEADIFGATISLSEDSFVYNGQAQKPTATVIFNGITLQEGVDYELRCFLASNYREERDGKPVIFYGDQSNSINADSYYVLVEGKGNFDFANSEPYTINPAPLTVKANNKTITYGDAPTNDGVIYEGFVNGESETALGGTLAYDYGYTQYGDVGEFNIIPKGLSSDNYTITFEKGTLTVKKADQNAPAVQSTNETLFGKNDGVITGVDTTMEYRKDGESTYTAISGDKLENLAAGKYYVRVKGDSNHNPSPDTTITVGEGRKLRIVVPQNPVGYTVTVNKTEMEYEGSYTLKVEINEGYTATEDFKIIISNWDCGQQPGVEETYMNAIADQIIEVQGVADETAPEAEISISTNKWASFLDTITFGLFFKETQDVTITATDKGSGVDTIYYYISEDTLTEDEVKALTADKWTEYDADNKPSIDPDKECVVYAKATDKAQNVKFISSTGLVFDGTEPALVGIENGGIYYGDKIFKALDDNFLKIEVDGEDITDTTEGDDEYKIVADNAEHTVTVTDKAGNITEWKITVYKQYTVTFMDENGVYKTVTVKHDEKVTMPEAPTKDGYTVTWEKEIDTVTADVTVKAVYTKIPVADTNSPQTDDNTNLWLLFALAFVSGAVSLRTAISGKKTDIKEDCF